MRRHERQSGAVLVEFALVALAFYLLLAATVELGRMVFVAQAAQQVARTAARELSLTPLPALTTFEEALADESVQASAYSRDHLVIDLDTVVDLDAYFAGLPVINRALRPLMVSERRDVDGGERNLLRVPGALIRWPTAPSGLSVAVPKVVARDGDGAETIEWREVLEEVRPDRQDPATGPFGLHSSGPDACLVAVRINVPFQSAAFSAFQPSVEGPFAPNMGNVVKVGTVTEVNASPGELAGGGSTSNPTLAGAYSLGHQFALGEEVRPFRRLISAQALFRRELFSEQASVDPPVMPPGGP